MIKLLIECVTKFYAYCPIVLTSPDDLKYLPRKNYLILGRIRTKNTQKRKKVLQQNEPLLKIESTGENLVSCSADSNKQNDVIESDNCDLSNARNIPSEISENADQIYQQQADFQDAPGETLESNQENESVQINHPNLLSDTNHTVLIKENKQIRTHKRAKTINAATKKMHSFVKPDPDQVVAEARAKEKK